MCSWKACLDTVFYLSNMDHECLLNDFFLNTVTFKYEYQTTSQKYYLFRFINSAALYHQEAIIFQTKTNRFAAWIFWNSFLVNIGIQKSVFLGGLSLFQQNVTIHNFSQAVIESTSYKISNKTWSK